MAKIIKIEYKGVEYTLEYTRKSVQKLELCGFKIDDLGDKPITMLPKLFWGAFICHHPNIKEDLATEIFEQIENKNDLITKLVEMYSDPLTALIGEPTEKGKAKWEVNW